jgi:bacteriocin biosynthesis cyclodehydratase domain-containing protein
MRQLQDLPSTRVVLGPGANSLEVELRRIDIPVASYQGQPATLLVIGVRSYLESSLQAVSESAAAIGLPWMPVSLSGATGFIGPVLGTQFGACWRCLTARAHPAQFRPRSPAVGAAPAIWRLAAESIQYWLQDPSNRIANSLLRLDTTTSRVHEHPVRHYPSCKYYCAPLVPRAPLPLIEPDLNWATGSGWRTREAAATLRSWLKLVDPLFGEVPEVAPITLPGRPELRVATATYRAVDGHLHTALGKGCSEQEACASALGEAFEREALGWREDLPHRLATLSDLRSESVIVPSALQHFSAAQQSRGEAPRPFREDLLRPWTATWSLRDHRRIWVPSALVYFGAPDPDGSAAADSNGVAAGNELGEAVVHAIFELIERDAYAIWWANRLRRPPIAREILSLPNIAEQIEAHASLGRNLEFLDITHDLGIPVVVAVSWSSRAPEGLLFCAGAQFDHAAAAMRAVNEVNQRLIFLELGRPSPLHIGAWMLAARRREFPQLIGDAAAAPAPQRRFEVARPITSLVSALMDVGVEPSMVDLTRPEIGVPVTRVIAPGLRHYWERHAAGRLYDVPVALKWLDRATKECDLAAPPALIRP